MKKKYQKEIRNKIALSFISRPVYKVLYFFILFFIFIGDSVLFFITTSFKFFVSCIRYVKNILFNSLFSLFKLCSKVINLVVSGCVGITRYWRYLASKVANISITIPSVSLPKPSLPKPSLPKPTITLPSLDIKRFIPKIPPMVFPTFPTLKLPSLPALPQFKLPQFKLPVLNTKVIEDRELIEVESAQQPKRDIIKSLPKVHISFKLPRLKIPKWKMPTIIFPRRVFGQIGKLTLFNKKSAKRKKIIVKPRFRFYMRIPFASKLRYFVFGVGVALVLMLTQQGYLFVKSLPNPKLIGSVNYPMSTHIYDRNGKLLYEIYREQNRTPIPLSELPAYIPNAAIAIEDKDFKRHIGVSFISGIARALKEIIIKGDLQGGSTITQQLVKSALLTPERTITRKIKEIILAIWTEQLYTKQQILGMYLNQVAYGGSSYGIEEAAKTYFSKHAKDLTIDEAALLAGLPQAPTSYSPYNNPSGAIYRRNDVLKKMREQGYITEDQYNDAVAKPLAIAPFKTNIHAPHFVFYVKDALVDKYGIKQVEEGGMKVTTSLDLDIQEKAEKIIREELDKVKGLNISDAGLVITKPSTGEILAMVGSKDYFAAPSGAYNVTTALRQPGSSIKPLLYSLALDRGYTAASMIDDSPTAFTISASEVYRPVNYDGKFHGRVPVRYALANSFNIPAVKILNSIGVDSFVTYSKNMGITTWDDSSRFGLSLTLGGGEVRMVDMATAFGVFANKGYRVDLSGIDKIVGPSDEEIYTLDPEKKRVISEGNAYIMSDMMSDNFARTMAFGPHSALEVPGYKVSVKTGTTDNKKDNWTIGYTPDFLVAVWVGNFNGEPMNQALASGITGAAPIWNRVINLLIKEYGTGTNWFAKPETVVEQVCYYGRKEYFLKGTENTANCKKGLLESTNPSTKPNGIN